MNSTNGTAEPISLQDAAGRLGISDRSVRRYIQRLGIRPEYTFTVMGRRLRIEPEDLNRIAAELSARCRAGVNVGQVADSPSGDPIEGSGQGPAKVSASRPEGAAGLPALPDAALERLGDVIRQAVAQGVQDGLRQAKRLALDAGAGGTAGTAAQDSGAGDTSRKAVRWIEGTAYAVLIAVLSGCGWIGWTLLGRVQDFAR